MVEVRRYDVVVVGAGMAGTSAALAASRAGARVALLEKQAEPGGSAALSVGMFWTAPSVEAYRRRIPRGDVALAERVVADHRETLEEIRALGARVAEAETRDIMTFGIGWSIDVRAMLSLARAEVQAAGGRLATGATAVELLQDEARAVAGVLVREAAGALVRYEAGATVLATGGFQGAPELLARYVGPHADRLVLRSNRGSVGDGLRLATGAGASATAGLATYYGHLLPYPLDTFGPEDFTPMTQYYSDATLLVNLRGERFCDETLGDEILNQAVTLQPEGRGVMLFDHDVRSTRAVAESFPGLGAVDRFDLARRGGGRCAEAATLEQLVRTVTAWGVDGDRLARTLQHYTDVTLAGGGVSDGVPVSPSARAPHTGPFYALMVQPSVTFTLGGVRIDTDARALDADGRPVPGLHVAGSDIGGLSNEGYAGGLAPAYITGRWAGRAAAAVVGG
ncbi:FAD-dependent oxidoreductase [Cellulomonas sp. Sa3CUA2]|uniref:FAD-dependent oxidoreductase n=1 Tax=Cellulomonas avistercoris TaxID=2762242 RepID=A0ABR8QGQ1_9CELL|nr:FAD-dependent oxidoreductase [Cellulomonas avistercoris]MBD7919608.1 FAD-dependent oxidoreductase [Cellulomonas avistercoris]